MISDAELGRADEDPIESRFTFTAYVNGSYFRAEDFQAIETGDQLIFEGEKAGNSIILQMPADIVNGDYNLGASIDTSIDYSASVTINGQTQQISFGSMTVLNHTADTGNINGTFNFQTADFKVTRGVFKLF